MAARTSAQLQAIIDAVVRGALTKRQARRLAQEDPDVVVLALLAASKRIAELGGRLAEQPGQSDARSPAPKKAIRAIGGGVPSESLPAAHTG